MTWEAHHKVECWVKFYRVEPSGCCLGQLTRESYLWRNLIGAAEEQRDQVNSHWAELLGYWFLRGYIVTSLTWERISNKRNLISHWMNIQPQLLAFGVWFSQDLCSLHIYGKLRDILRNDDLEEWLKLNVISYSRGTILYCFFLFRFR